MPIPQLPGVGLNSLEDVINYVIRLEREIRFLMESGLDSSNMFEAGGWRVGPDSLTSLDQTVGMSSQITAGDDIRFFAGDVITGSPKYKVTKGGILTAVDGNFIGGVIRTNFPGSQRIELTAGSFKGYTADDLLSGLVFDPNKINDIVDLFLYHRGNQLLQFYDNIDGFQIKPGSGSTYMWLGTASKYVYGWGNWIFQNSVDLGPNVATGKVQYAGYADAAASSSVANSVDWANVTNHPDPTSVPLMAGTASLGDSNKYAREDHVHPSDNSKANSATTLAGYGITDGAKVVSGGANVQSGSFSIASQAFNANAYYTFHVTFPTPFVVVPSTVQLTLNAGNPGDTWMNASAENRTTTGFDIILSFGAAKTSGLVFSWEAK